MEAASTLGFASAQFMMGSIALNHDLDHFLGSESVATRHDWDHPALGHQNLRLRKSLYGHPESGAHWARYLERAVVKLGGQPVDGHPSTFFFKERNLLLTVCVDGLLLSGSAASHTDPSGRNWEKLSKSRISVIWVGSLLDTTNLSE